LLIIDDDKGLCSLLSERIKAEGFELEAAHDSNAGLELAVSGVYSLVILDVMLPGLGGMEVLKMLRSRSNIPVLMLTARGDDVDRIIALSWGLMITFQSRSTPRAACTHQGNSAETGRSAPGPDRMSAGDITIDVA